MSNEDGINDYFDKIAANYISSATSGDDDMVARLKAEDNAGKTVKEALRNYYTKKMILETLDEIKTFISNIEAKLDGVSQDATKRDIITGPDIDELF